MSTRSRIFRCHKSRGQNKHIWKINICRDATKASLPWKAESILSGDLFAVVIINHKYFSLKEKVREVLMTHNHIIWCRWASWWWWWGTSRRRRAALPCPTCQRPSRWQQMVATYFDLEIDEDGDGVVGDLVEAGDEEWNASVWEASGQLNGQRRTWKKVNIIFCCLCVKVFDCLFVCYMFAIREAGGQLNEPVLRCENAGC